MTGDDGFLAHLLSEAKASSATRSEIRFSSRKPRWNAPVFSGKSWPKPSSPKGIAPRASCAAAWCAGLCNRPSICGSCASTGLLARRHIGISLMLALLGVVLYLTLSGANVPSAWLSETLSGFEPRLSAWLLGAGAPPWLTDALVSGVYRVTSWVVSVMPAAHGDFLPALYLLEDLGLSPARGVSSGPLLPALPRLRQAGAVHVHGTGLQRVGVMDAESSKVRASG